MFIIVVGHVKHTQSRRVMEQAYILVLETRFCGFNSHLSDHSAYAELAQLVEYLAYIQGVRGSSPLLCTKGFLVCRGYKKQALESGWQL